ncbi:MAG: hypothetical protein RRZ84_08285 [Romboutsia sp.]
MIKKISMVILTLLVMVVTNYLLANYFKVNFIELSFIVGLLYTLVIGFFSSEGGITTRMFDTKFEMLWNHESNSKNKFIKFYVNGPLVVAIAYTAISFIASVIIYWKYF